MNTSYQVKVNDQLELNITTADIEALDLITTAASTYHILQENISYNADIVEQNFSAKHYKVKIDDHIFSIQINNSLDQLIKDLGFETSNSKTVDKITAPMPGLILEISITIGDVIKENDPIIILEAMKMENIISSPRDGVIKSISVSQGEAVEKNQLLIEFEE